jgi:Zn-dependent protease with chaperone function
MTGVHLLLVAAVVATAAPRMLARADWVYRSPRLGIAAWYAVLAAVTSAVAAAVVSLVAPWRHGRAPVCVAWRWCAQAARGELGPAGRIAAVVIVGAGVALVARLVVCGLRLARAGAVQRREHLQVLGLAGRRSTELGVTVVDCAEPAAYLVAGPGRRIVVTSGALKVLTDQEVAAVLAHERAHAAGRHDLVMAGVRLWQAAFPAVALFAVARAQLGRLVEIRADEVAVARHRPISLARALVAMAIHAGSAACPVPAGVVAAGGGDAAERLRRLLQPPDRLPRAQRMALVAGIVAVALTPVALLVAAQVVPALGMCPAPLW